MQFTYSGCSSRDEPGVYPPFYLPVFVCACVSCTACTYTHVCISTSISSAASIDIGVVHKLAAAACSVVPQSVYWAPLAMFSEREPLNKALSTKTDTSSRKKQIYSASDPHKNKKKTLQFALTELFSSSMRSHAVFFYPHLVVMSYCLHVSVCYFSIEIMSLLLLSNQV